MKNHKTCLITFTFDSKNIVPLYCRGREKHQGQGSRRNARDEMEQLEKELFVLVEASGLDTPVLDQLHNASTPLMSTEAAGFASNETG